MDNFELGFAWQGSLAQGILLTLTLMFLAVVGYWGLIRKWHGRRALFLTLLRMAVLGVVVLLLCRPVVNTLQERPDSSRVAVLVDQSASMNIPDEGMDTSRFQAALRLLFAEDQGLLAGLEEHYQTDLYLFGRALDELHRDKVDRLLPDQEATDLYLALEEALARNNQADPTALVLLTDGRENSGPSVRQWPEPDRIPIHVIGLGMPEDGPRRLPDGAMREVRTDARVLTGDEITIQGSLTLSLSSPPREVEVELLLDNQVLRTRSIPVPAQPQDREVAFSFLWTPRTPGLHELGVRLKKLEEESYLENNLRTCLVEVSSERIELLIFESTPRWEFKFLKKALTRDGNLRVTSLVRTGPGRYLQQGDGPLDLSRGLPDNLEELAAFDCILLGEVGRADLSVSALENLRRYVESGMGGIVLSGSARTLSREGLEGSPLAIALPVNPPGVMVPRNLDQTVTVTAAGASHPVLQGLPFQGSVPVESLFPPASLKPGSQTLAVASGTDPDQALPFCVVQSYGKGRSAAVLSDTTWKWAMDRSGGQELHARFWGRLVRWAAGHDAMESDRSEALVLSQARLAPGEEALIRCPGEQALPRGVMTSETGRVMDLVFQSSAQGPEAVLAPEEGGFHGIHVERQDGTLIDETRIYCEGDPRERNKITQDRDLLRHLARMTGGTYCTLPEGGSLPSRVLGKSLSRMEKKEWRLADQSWIYLVVVGLLATEWLTRRRSGIV